MKRRPYLWLVFFSGLLLVCSGFVTDFRSNSTKDAAISAAATNVNLTEEANLDRATRIVIYRQADCAYPMRVYLKSIVDADVVNRLTDALNTEVELMERERGAASFEVDFHLDDGSVQRFDYDCCLASPTYLHGTQAYLAGQHAIAPDSFNALMAIELATMSEPACSPVSQ